MAGIKKNPNPFLSFLIFIISFVISLIPFSSQKKEEKREEAKEEEMADFSFLPADILELISKPLCFMADYVRFRSVCTSWRSAASETRPPHPWLIAHRESEKGEPADYGFFTLTADPICPLTLPPSTLGMPNCGSPRGWMTLLDRRGGGNSQSLTLLNLFTGSELRLPPFTDDETKNQERYISCFGDMESSLASKIVLSSSDSVVLAVRQDARRLEFCRPGDGSWTLVGAVTVDGFCADALFYRGRFLVATYDAVYACTASVSGEELSVKMLARNREAFLSRFEECYFVECYGCEDLLMVTLRFSLKKKYSIEVYRVMLYGDQISLVKLETLGGRAVFLGRNHSFCLSLLPGRSPPQCRSNCVYIAEHYMTEYFNGKQTMIRVYNLGDGSTELISSDLARPNSEWKPCGWFVP